MREVKKTRVSRKHKAKGVHPFYGLFLVLLFLPLVACIKLGGSSEPEIAAVDITSDLAGNPPLFQPRGVEWLMAPSVVKSKFKECSDDLASRGELSCDLTKDASKMKLCGENVYRVALIFDDWINTKNKDQKLRLFTFHMGIDDHPEVTFNSVLACLKSKLGKPFLAYKKKPLTSSDSDESKKYVLWFLKDKKLTIEYNYSYLTMDGDKKPTRQIDELIVYYDEKGEHLKRALRDKDKDSTGSLPEEVFN